MSNGSVVSGSITPEELRVWLEWAGIRLSAMPVLTTKPKDPGVFWPEYSQDKFQLLEFRKGIELRALAPTRDEIPIVDEILSLPNVCFVVKKRRVLHKRALIHPIHGTYLHSWREIADMIDEKQSTTKRFHREGLEEAARKADPAKVYRVRAFGL